MNSKRWDARFLGLVAMAVALACESGAPTAAPATPRADELSASVVASAHAARIGWEIFGSASDTARDGLKITVTGSGTFIAPADGRGTSDEAGRHFRHDAVTGGGTWETRNASGVTGSGTYVVTGLVSWVSAGPQACCPFLDTIDDGTRTNGTAVLTISFSDGAQGVLTVGCHGPAAPAGIFEGIATTKGYTTYYSVQPPTGGVDANRTIFHILSH